MRVLIFHILTREHWERAERAGTYHPPSLEQEGFIHFSEDRQLLRTAGRFYAGKTDLVVLRVQTEKLRAELRYETADGESFPHLYGELNLDAVVEVVALPYDAKTGFDVPSEWARWAEDFRAPSSRFTPPDE